MENNKVVIDTNVFISAIIGQTHGYPYKIFDEIVLTGGVTLCISEQLLNEYEEVSQREKFRKIPLFSEKAVKLIQSLKSISLVIKPTERITKIADDPDNRVLEVASAANAIAIVTGNINDFSFTEFRGIRIQTPKEFYDFFMENS